DVSAQANSLVDQRPERLDVAGERALHVRDAEAVETALARERFGLEARNVREPGLAARVRRVHVPVEHQGRAAAVTTERADDIRATLLDLLPLNCEPELAKRVGHERRHRLLAPREARDRDRPARPLDEPVAVYAHTATS